MAIEQVVIGPSGISYAFDINRRVHEYKVQALNQQDLDRHMNLATTNIFKWMQAARMELPWMQAGYRAFSQVHPAMTRRLLVGSQLIKLDEPGLLSEAVDHEVTTRVEIGDIGKTTIEFRYTIFFGERRVGTGSTVMIATAGTPGNFKPSPAPDDVKALSALEPSANAKFMKESLVEVGKQAPDGAYAFAMSVRYSDEDVNKHANHSAQARYFEDVKEVITYDEKADPTLRAIAEQQLESIMISYVAEARALDQLVVKVASVRAGCLDIWVERTAPNPGMVARGRMVCSGGKGENSDQRRLRTSAL